MSSIRNGRSIRTACRSRWWSTRLHDYDRAHGLKSVCLRYFNAAGAHPDGSIGERHDPETHLIPLVLQVASGGASPSACSAATTTRLTAPASATTSTSSICARRTCSRCSG